MSTFDLKRRGFEFGSINTSPLENQKAARTAVSTDGWHLGKPIILNGLAADDLHKYAKNLKQSKELYSAILNEQNCDSLLSLEPYHSRVLSQFESLGASFNEGDQQEIETVFFDAIVGNDIVAEDLWMKLSWLSFHEEDASLRFRFSFGVDFEEDVAMDPKRQLYAAKLTNSVFPESTLITSNNELLSVLRELLSAQTIHFVERIVYFNAPNGGAYLHHDRERGHAGVVYAQLTGQTYWLALPKHELVSEIRQFIHTCERDSSWPESINAAMQKELSDLADKQDHLSRELDSFANNTLIHLINETKEFVQYLAQHGYAQLIGPGDMLLLPQESDESCCWHSVFNIGQDPGQALSFAIRGD